MLKYLHKDRYINHWNVIESLELNSHIYVQFLYDNSAKIIQCGENGLVTNSAGTIGYHMQKMSLDPLLFNIFKSQLIIDYRPKCKS